MKTRYLYTDQLKIQVHSDKKFICTTLQYLSVYIQENTAVKDNMASAAVDYLRIIHQAVLAGDLTPGNNGILSIRLARFSINIDSFQERELSR